MFFLFRYIPNQKFEPEYIIPPSTNVGSEEYSPNTVTPSLFTLKASKLELFIRKKSEVRRDYTKRKLKSAKVSPEGGNAYEPEDSKQTEKSEEATSLADDFRFPGQ